MFDDDRIFHRPLPVQQRYGIVGQQIVAKVLDLPNNQIPTGNQNDAGFVSMRPDVLRLNPIGPSMNLSPAGSAVGRTQAALMALYYPPSTTGS